MDKVSDYIFVMNAIPKDLCESLIDECNKNNGKSILGMTMEEIKQVQCLKKN